MIQKHISILITAIILLSGCTNPLILKNDAEFNDQSANAIVLLRTFSLEDSVLCIGIIEIGPCDPYASWAYVQNGVVDWKYNDLYLRSGNGELNAFLAKPGMYALDFVDSYGGSIRMLPRPNGLPPRKIAHFTVNAGEVVYVGDLSVETLDRTFDFLLHDNYEDAVQFMKKNYPEITEPIIKRLMTVFDKTGSIQK